MEKYYHGVRTQEEATVLNTPAEGTAGLQVVFGTAPVNLAADPYGSVNVPRLCSSFEECREWFGYSDDFKKYTLCMSMDASFNLFKISPVVLVNVLDPAKHRKKNEPMQYTVADNQVLVNVEGILADTITVTDGETELKADEDYITSFNEEGYIIITLLKEENVLSVTVSSESIDPDAVEKADVIGGYDISTGKESGIETVRQVYPRFGYTPGQLLAPGWSKYPEVAAVLAAKSEGINGVFKCENLIDLDTNAARKYTDCKNVKEENGLTDKHSFVLWPMVQVGSKMYAYSAIYGAMVAYMDASNDDVPNLYPSNKELKITGTVLEDGKEVILDQEQANTLNGQGIITALNYGGWKSWGNNTAAYPQTEDPKDRWIACRRFFSWWGNSFILTYRSKVDDMNNEKLIQAVCDSENIRGNSYVSQGKCAGMRIEYAASENNVQTLLDGKMVFRTYLAPYTPAEDIRDILAFDPDMLTEALG